MIKQLKLEILDENSGVFFIKTGSELENAFFRFNPATKELSIESENQLTSFLKSNEYQLRKLLHNKRKDTFKVGFKLSFSIIDGKDIDAFNNKQNIVVTDHGNVYTLNSQEKRPLVEIYTDGSYSEKHSTGAYSFLIKDMNNLYTEKAFKSDSKSSSLIELDAVIAALSYYPKDVRIITDSQYVRKGITEWIIHWKLNDWTTANGSKAKNIDRWMYLDRLCNERYIEFEWVKSHNNNFENEYCDYLARQRSLD